MAHGSQKYLCGVPAEECGGGKGGLAKSIAGCKTHGSTDEASRCRKRYLINKGYVRIDSRAFQPPDGGPIEIIPKVSHFTRLRIGKGGEKGGGNRYMPRDRTGGIIIA